MEHRLKRAGLHPQQLAQIPRASAKMQTYIFHYSKSMATTQMRFLSLVLLSSFSVASFAAEKTPGKPELPPPPAMDNGASEEPQVTITKKSGQTIEEYRIGGRLYMIKVTPKVGPPYYLVDDKGDGKFARQESLDSGFRPPSWVIHRF